MYSIIMMMVMFCNALLYMVLTLRLIYNTKTKHKVLFVSLFLTILTYIVTII